MEVYIARDADGEMWLFGSEPVLVDGEDWCAPTKSPRMMKVELLPDSTSQLIQLKPGECRKAVITLA